MSQHAAETATEPISRVGSFIAGHLPGLLTACGLALLGWLAAVLLRKLARFLVTRTQERLDRVPWLQTRMQQVPAIRTAPKLISGVVFWTVLLFFLVAAIDALGLPAVSDLLGRAATYLPRVLAAMLILLGGVLLGDVITSLLPRALAGMGVEYGEVPARAAQALVIVVAAIIGIEQLGIDSTVLTLVLSIMFGTTLGAAGLAFGLGARSTVANMLAVQQLSKIYRTGDTVHLGDVEGRIIEITQTMVILEVPQGRAMIPGYRFSDEVSVRVAPGG